MLVRIQLHNRILKLRSIERLLEKPEFDNLYQQKKEEIDRLIADENLEALIEIYKTCRDSSIYELSYNGLRELAKQRRIPGYSRMSRAELIRSIENEK